MIFYKTKYALCIKDGFMTQGRQFCIKNKVYKYTTATTKAHKYTHKYSVKSESSCGCDHSMSDAFFEKYFLPDWEPSKHTPLEDDLFEI